MSAARPRTRLTHRTPLLFLLQPNSPGDLTSGELFAPRFKNQVGPTNTATGAGAEWDVEWVSLARATHADLEALRSTLTFSAIFDTATCTVTANVPSCPSGFTRVANSAYSVSSIYCECLKLKPVRACDHEFLGGPVVCI